MVHTVEDESVFKELHARVERESGQKLKAVRANNGGEYRGQFEEYYRSKGIQLEFTVLKTPELNGLAERMNQTLMERVWSMLAHAKLPKTFWAEALSTTTYVINRSPPRCPWMETCRRRYGPVRRYPTGI